MRRAWRRSLLRAPMSRRLLRFAEKYKPAGYDRLDDFKSEMKLCVSDLKCDQYFYHELLRKKAESESLYDYIPS